ARAPSTSAPPAPSAPRRSRRRAGPPARGRRAAPRPAAPPPPRTAPWHRPGSPACPRARSAAAVPAAGADAGAACSFAGDAELVHAPVQRLPRQAQLAGGLADDAAGARQRGLDLGAVGLVLGRSRRDGGREPEVG